MNEETALPTHERIFRLAQCLKITPGTRGLWLEKYDNKWWIIGGKDGDTPLPQTHNAKTGKQALEQAEAWLAWELREKERTHGNSTGGSALAHAKALSRSEEIISPKEKEEA